jgi:hypothetical protein
VARDRDELGFSDWAMVTGEVRGFGAVTTQVLERFAREVVAPLR